MSIARHTAYNLTGAVTALAVSLVTVPLYLSVIGIERFGILSVCWLLVGYFGLFELGLGPATVQRMSSLAGDTTESRSALLWTALPLSGLVGSLGALVLYFAGEQALLAIRDLDSHFVGEIDRSMVWLAVAMPLVTMTAVLNGALQGRKAFAASSAFTTALHTISTVAPLIVAHLAGPELPALIATVAACRLVALVALFGLCRRRVPVLRPVMPTLGRTKSLASFGGWVTLNGLVTPLLLSAEKFLTAWRLGPAAVALYMVPYNLVSRFLLIPQSLYTAIVPDLTIVTADEARQIERRAVSGLCAITAPLCVAGLALMKGFMDLWVGAAIAERSALIGIILLAGMWANACAYIPHARFQASGRPDLVTKISLAQLIPYLVILVFVLDRWGLIAAAVLWSARVALEALIYFAVGRNFVALVKAMAPGAALVTCSAVVALNFASHDISGWALQIAILALAIANLLRNLPSDLRRSLTGRLFAPRPS